MPSGNSGFVRLRTIRLILVYLSQEILSLTENNPLPNSSYLKSKTVASLRKTNNI
jgi:hypothetical protein